MPTVSDDSDKFAFKISCDWSLSYRTVAESLFGVILTNIRVGVEKNYSTLTLISRIWIIKPPRINNNNGFKQR